MLRCVGLMCCSMNNTFNQHTSASPPPNKGETNPARCQEMSEQEQGVNWETNALSRWCDHSAPAAHLKICLSGEIWQKFPNVSSSSFSIQQEFLGGIPYLSNLLGPKNVDPNYSAYVSSKLDELCKWPRGREGGNTRTSPSWDTVSVESRDEQQLCLKTNSRFCESIIKANVFASFNINLPSTINGQSEK